MVAWLPPLVPTGRPLLGPQHKVSRHRGLGVARWLSHADFYRNLAGMMEWAVDGAVLQ
jgi:hypothetical protein